MNDKLNGSASPAVEKIIADAQKQPAAPVGPQPAHHVHITLFDNGQVTVNGPLDNPILFYGMMESAKDAAREFNIEARKAAKPKIHIPNVVSSLLSRAKALAS